MDELATMYGWHRCPRLLFKLASGEEELSTHQEAIARGLSDMSVDRLLVALKLSEPASEEIFSRIVLLVGNEENRELFTVEFNGSEVGKVRSSQLLRRFHCLCA